LPSERLGHRFDGDPSAPVLACSGSLGSTLAMWEPQLPLAERCRLLRFDHPGHGSSPPRVEPLTIDDLGRGVVELLDELELERVSFCGLSLGGMVGMWLASRAPTRVDCLVLCATSARLGPPEFWDERAELVRREGMAAVVETVLGRWFTPRFHETRPAEVERFRAMLLGAGPESYARCCEAIRDLDLRDDLQTIVAPTIVIVGADDPSTPVEHAETIARGIPDSRLLVIPDAAHLVTVERADAVNDAVLEHLAVAA
jgi:3-oxoadipate enol-lactonase